MSTDLQLALTPTATYDRLVQTRQTGRAAALAGRLVLAAAVIGVNAAVLATGRVSLELAGGLALWWSFVLLVQAVAAAAVILPARGRAVTALRAFELWFQSHVPWTLWLLLAALLSILMGRKVGDTRLTVAALLPLAWTAVLLAAFARQVLRSRRPALVVAVHQMVLWGLALCYVAYAIGGWDRVVAELGL